MSSIPLDHLARTSGTIMVHVDAGDAGRFGLDIDSDRIVPELDAFEHAFNVGLADRQDRDGHAEVLRRLLDACRIARKFGPSVQDAYDQSLVLGVVWDVVNDPVEGGNARLAILERLSSGMPVHVRARQDRLGVLRCRVLTGEPGDRDDVEWMKAAA